MTRSSRGIYIIYDDRDLTSAHISEIVGKRPYGDILFRRKTLSTHFKSSLPSWCRKNIHHIKKNQQLTLLRDLIEKSPEDISLLFISASAGISDFDRFNQLIERLPYAEADFIDQRYGTLLHFYKDGHDIISNWKEFEKKPLHKWEIDYKGVDQVNSIHLYELSNTQDFLSYISGATEARHFNEIEIDRFIYTKRSTDKKKMAAEYHFYNLVPEKMRPWLIHPFDFNDEGESASYKMLRYYVADAALQWIHKSFSDETFSQFIDKLMYFINTRPHKKVTEKEVSVMGDALFVSKVESRLKQLLTIPEGKRINDLIAISNPEAEVMSQFERYKTLYRRYKKEINSGNLTVGHGDPCFSNILYDQQRQLLTLIDPKGATEERNVWTHPLYDVCKISHSIFGNYDFINNGLFNVKMNSDGAFELDLQRLSHDKFKSIFHEKLTSLGLNWKLVRLVEASLFLSMLPLHLDHSNKVIAFILNANLIMNEIEG